MPRETKAARTCSTCAEVFETAAAMRMHAARKMDAQHVAARAEPSTTTSTTTADEEPATEYLEPQIEAPATRLPAPPELENPQGGTETPSEDEESLGEKPPADPPAEPPENPPTGTPPPGTVWGGGPEAEPPHLETDPVGDLQAQLRTMSADELAIACDTTTDTAVDVVVAMLNERLKTYETVEQLGTAQVQALKTVWRPVLRKYAPTVLEKPEIAAVVVTGIVLAPTVFAAYAEKQTKAAGEISSTTTSPATAAGAQPHATEADLRAKEALA